MKNQGELRYFIGMELARSKRGLVISQRKYIFLIYLKKQVWVVTNLQLHQLMQIKKLDKVKNGTTIDVSQYQRLVGRLIYVSQARPDIAFTVSMISQFLHIPLNMHLDAAHRILRYLKSYLGRGLFLKKNNDRRIEVSTKANWERYVTEWKSTSVYCTFLWGNLVI